MNIARNQTTDDRRAAVERRRALFLSALGAAKLTQAGWAKAHGITPSHLHHVLSGRESRTLEEKIEAFIEKQTEKKSALVA